MSNQLPDHQQDREMVVFPVPYLNAECRVISAASSKYLLLEFRPAQPVPGEIDVVMLNLRKLWPLTRAQFYAHFFRQAAQLVARDGKLLPSGDRVHPVRMNEPGQYTELVAWLTAEHCEQIAEAIERQTRLALAGRPHLN